MNNERKISLTEATVRALEGKLVEDDNESFKQDFDRLAEEFKQATGCHSINRRDFWKASDTTGLYTASYRVEYKDNTSGYFDIENYRGEKEFKINIYRETFVFSSLNEAIESINTLLEKVDSFNIDIVKEFERATGINIDYNTRNVIYTFNNRLCIRYEMINKEADLTGIFSYDLNNNLVSVYYNELVTDYEPIEKIIKLLNKENENSNGVKTYLVTFTTDDYGKIGYSDSANSKKIEIKAHSKQEAENIVYKEYKNVYLGKYDNMFIKRIK